MGVFLINRVKLVCLSDLKNEKERRVLKDVWIKMWVTHVKLWRICRGAVKSVTPKCLFKAQGPMPIANGHLFGMHVTTISKIYSIFFFIHLSCVDLFHIKNNMEQV